MNFTQELKNVALCFIVSLLTVFFANKIYHLEPMNVSYHDMAKEKAVHVRRFQAPAYDNKTYGTGFDIVYKNQAFVITNAHVCKVSERLGTPDTAIVNGERLRILKIWDEHDLCALKTPRRTGLRLAYQDVDPLDKVTLIGHPRGLDMVVREGRIVQEDKEISVMGTEGLLTFKADQVSTTAYGGNSGSPLLNEYGRVVGVLFAGQNTYPHEPLVVPYEYLKKFLNELTQE